MQLCIENEYDTLEAVLVHRPGWEIDRLTHENMRRFLIEDIPYLRRMQEEHDAFVGTMRQHGIEVLYIEDLVRDVLASAPAREALMDEICHGAMVPAMAPELASLNHWDAEQLVGILFAGLTAEEYQDKMGRNVASAGGDDQFLLPPIPNAYFTRDPAVVVRDAVISCKMHYPARVRESILTRAVLEHHPEFRGNKITYGGTAEPTEDRPYTIEGGDVIVLSPDAVLVGASERTRSETISLLAAKCFQFGSVKRVYEVPIPTERAFMHLDTVFTIVDRGTVSWYPAVMDRVSVVQHFQPDTDGRPVRVKENRSLLEVLRDEFESDVTVIPTAGGKARFASREQRADGTNAFAIAPRVVIVYERNERTNAALEQHGVTCIGIDDSELVRGLGGPRCMTMPLRRRPAILPS